MRIARLNRLPSKPAAGAITISTGPPPRPRLHSRAGFPGLAGRAAPARTAVPVPGS